MRLPKITDSEYEIMKLLWKKNPLTAHEIITALSKEKEWSEQTIKTFLNRLHNKKAIYYEKQGRNYLYYPIVTESAFYQFKNQSFLQQVYSGGLTMLFSHFIEQEELSEIEIAELQQLLEQKKASLNKTNDKRN